MEKESIYFKVTNIKDKHDLKKIKRELSQLPGVMSVSVNTDDKKVAVDFDSTGASQASIEGSLSNLGFQIAKDGKQDIM